MNQKRDWKIWCQLGGVSLILIGTIYLLIFATYAIVQPDFESGLHTAAVAYLTEPKVFALPITIISSVGGILYLPAILGLYFALKQTNNPLMVSAVGLTMVMIPLILAQNIFNVAVMAVSSQYTAANSEVLKTAYAAAATVALSASFGAELFIVGIFSVATVLVSVVMLQANFGARTAYFGIITGAFNLIGQMLSAVLGNNHSAVLTMVFLGLLLNIIWFIVVGYKLYRLPAETLDLPAG